MYNNQADAFITTAKTIKKVAEKSKSENAVHTINALTFGTHVYQQREELIANSNDKQRTDGITITTDLGSGKEYTSCIKIFEDGRHLVYMELNKALAEEAGAA